MYEVYKSLYDDTGKLIREEIENIRKRNEASAGNSTLQSEIGERSKSVVATEPSGLQLKSLLYQNINSKYVMLNRLEAARNQTNNKKIQKFIEMEEDDAIMAEMHKNKGLLMID